MHALMEIDFFLIKPFDGHGNFNYANSISASSGDGRLVRNSSIVAYALIAQTP